MNPLPGRLLGLAAVPYRVVADTVASRVEPLLPSSRHTAPDALPRAVAWLCRSHDVTGRRGSSKGFSLLRGWLPAYPETTGYVIGTLLDYQRCSDGDGDLALRAREMGEWEIEVQNPDGGVREGTVDRSRPSVVFNTGMVIHGWVDLYLETGEQAFVEAALRAGAFLEDRQDDDGAWRGANQYSGIPHTYDSRVAWALLRLADAAHEPRLREVAVRALAWTISMQRANGFFESCAFKPGMLPSTHAIAYTLRGLLESYVDVGDESYLQAVMKTSEVLIRKAEVFGSLPATYDSSWKARASYSCVTGTAQLGGVWLRLYQVTDDARFLNAGLKAIDEAGARQARLQEADGALPGSFPIQGRYAPLQFPNWATKLFADALMLRDVLISTPEG